jgi:hypothetical protein
MSWPRLVKAWRAGGVQGEEKRGRAVVLELLEEDYDVKELQHGLSS